MTGIAGWDIGGAHLKLARFEGETIVAAVQLHVLKAYQIDRFLAFLNPTLDPRGAGYNTTQARIAIGNGGVFGQGLFHGSQTKAGFVPEQHTDFIFTVVGEELGFLGGATLIGLYSLLAWRIWRTARLSSDFFGTLLAVGVLGILAFQVFENIGMTMGIMPITGIPLPFMSYGGSAIIASFIAIGLVANVNMRRFS